MDVLVPEAVIRMYMADNSVEYDVVNLKLQSPASLAITANVIIRQIN